MRVIITFHVSYNIYAKALWSPWYGPQPEIFILKLIKVYVLLVFWKFPVLVNSIFGAASGSLSFLSGIRKLSRGVNLPKSEWLMLIFFEIRVPESKCRQKLSLCQQRSFEFFDPIWLDTKIYLIKNIPEDFWFHVNWMQKMVITSAVSTETIAMKSWHN